MKISKLTAAILDDEEYKSLCRATYTYEALQQEAELSGFNEMKEKLDGILNLIADFTTKYIRNKNEVWFQ